MNPASCTVFEADAWVHLKAPPISAICFVIVDVLSTSPGNKCCNIHRHVECTTNGVANTTAEYWEKAHPGGPANILHSTEETNAFQQGSLHKKATINFTIWYKSNIYLLSMHLCI